jgi:hypothetical protein
MNNPARAEPKDKSVVVAEVPELDPWRNRMATLLRDDQFSFDAYAGEIPEPLGLADNDWAIVGEKTRLVVTPTGGDAASTRSLLADLIEKDAFVDLVKHLGKGEITSDAVGLLEPFAVQIPSDVSLRLEEGAYDPECTRRSPYSVCLCKGKSCS